MTGVMVVHAVTAFEAFGEALTLAEVEDRVPHVVMLDGPMAGGVYVHITPPADPLHVDRVIYWYRGELVRLPDGRLARGYRYGYSEGFHGKG